MGRYYNGDIEGKFMFAVQSSAAADRFGSAGSQDFLDYYFDKSHLETISKELSALKPAWVKVNNFFDEGKKNGRTGYTDEDLKDAGISEQDLSDYADYNLGKKIEECVIEEGECHFEAEL